jgi:hypothetical protein
MIQFSNMARQGWARRGLAGRGEARVLKQALPVSYFKSQSKG